MHFTSKEHRLAALLAAPLVLSAVDSSCAAQEPARRPNIIFILADDLGYMDVGFNGGTIADTPNLDRLAAEGMRFANAYAPAPICSASRAAILTGRSPARLHFEFVTRHPNSGQSLTSDPLQPPPYSINLPLAEVTIPEVLGPAGYATAFMGKWHVSAHYEGRYLHWSPTHGPEQQGFDIGVLEFGMHPYSHNQPGAPEPPPAEHFAPGEFPEDALTTRTIDYIRTTSGAEPFFLYLSHFYVHEPIRNQVQWLTDKYTARLRPDDKPVRAEYAASVEILDHHIGRLLNAIDEAGIRDNTLVVFFSDNGGDPRFTRHAPLRGHKWTLYEGGVRVPMAVRWPGVVEPNSTIDTPVIGTDLLPTFAQAANAPLDPSITLDGVSLLPLFKGDTRTIPVARPMLFHFPYYHSKGRRDEVPQVAGIDDERVPFLGPQSSILEWPWKLVHWYEDNSVEVFNLERDPSEQENLAESHGAMVDELTTNLQRMLKSADARLPTRRE